MRNLQIEGLRGVSILIVMLYHFFYRYMEIFYSVENSPINSYLASDFLRYCFKALSHFGVIGTTMFFMISGYFLACRKLGGGGLLFSRLKKLWPVYFVSITIVFCITRFIDLPSRTVSFPIYLLNVIFVNGFLKLGYVDAAHWYITALLGAIIWFSVILQFDDKKRKLLYCCLAVYCYST